MWCSADFALHGWLTGGLVEQGGLILLSNQARSVIKTMFYGWISLIIPISCTRNLANTFNIERVNEQQVNKQSTIRLREINYISPRFKSLEKLRVVISY